MKKSIAIVFMIFAVVSLYSQDIITKRDGSEIKANVEEVGINEIRYKKFDNPSGPTYVISKAEVFMIEYQNGEKEVMETSTSTAIKYPQGKLTTDIIQSTRTAGIIGYAQATPVLGLATASAFAESFTAGGIIGGIATVGFGISAPLIASKARKTREISGVEGAPSARLVGWILYGVAMADAVSMLALDIAEIDVPAASVIAVGAFAAASSILFGYDAILTSEQSENVMGEMRVVPSVGISQTHFGHMITSVGVQVKF